MRRGKVRWESLLSTLLSTSSHFASPSKSSEITLGWFSGQAAISPFRFRKASSSLATSSLDGRSGFPSSGPKSRQGRIPRLRFVPSRSAGATTALMVSPPRPAVPSRAESGLTGTCLLVSSQLLCHPATVA